MKIDLASPICVALDSSDPAELIRLADAVHGSVGAIKVGLTAFTATGPELVRSLSDRHPLFLDLKLHDIPVQVAGAMSSIGSLGVSWTTVHAQGGSDMLRAAAEAAPADLMVLAVTVLTSLDTAELERTGLAGPPESAVLRLADLALASGVQGLVCSPLEVAAVRERFGPRSAGGPFLVVPGIRPSGSDVGDQRRTLGPREALEAGADLLVVGRPITAAPDPATAARDLLASL